MSEKLLELKNATIKFGGVTALNEVNFHVNKGEITASREDWPVPSCRRRD